MARFTEQAYGDRLVGKVDPLDQRPSQLPPDSPYHRPEVRDAALAAAERAQDAVEASERAHDDWNRDNAKRVHALRERQAASAAAKEAREETAMDPVKAVRALHQLIREARTPGDRQQLMAAVSALTKSKATKKSQHADSAAGALDRAVLTKVQGMVASALTKADETHKAELAGMRTELARLKEQPVAGGPVRIRVGRDRARAGGTDARSLLAQADEYEAKADAADDQTLAHGYRAIARDLRMKAGR
ncbi:hypothetical protein [Phycicoccus sp. 3266]|uniref:hypothetical protein n=1 Tax=Phycicoccus sp. 3266 TaxID=2817751 RepID=UPI002864B76E|nr:hypothetical protein [Phycicoccus sp. 3266]MDR6862179.1 hypothetical protein [Phycicoccus sp. 3266]